MAILSLTRDSNMATMTSCKRKLYEAQERENLLTAKRMQQSGTKQRILESKLKENATKRDNRKACENKENRTNFFNF